MIVWIHWLAVSENTFLVTESETKSKGSTERIKAGNLFFNLMTIALIVSTTSTKTVERGSFNCSRMRENFVSYILGYRKALGSTSRNTGQILARSLYHQCTSFG